MRVERTIEKESRPGGHYRLLVRGWSALRADEVSCLALKLFCFLFGCQSFARGCPYGILSNTPRAYGVFFTPRRHNPVVPLLSESGNQTALRTRELEDPIL